MVEPQIAAPSDPPLLIRGGRVYDHDGDVDDPPVRDILVRGSRIVSVTAPDEDAALKEEIVRRAAVLDKAQVIEARGKLVIPGFVNAHYHSYDVLAKGLLEDMPFDVWALHSQPAYFGRRSKAEIRARTLVRRARMPAQRHHHAAGHELAWCRRTRRHSTSSSPPTRRSASGSSSPSQCATSRRSTSPRFCHRTCPNPSWTLIRGAAKDAREEIAFVERQIKRLTPLSPRLSWGLSPSGPQRSSRALLEGVADLARRHQLPIFTHVYETKAQTAKARAIYGEHGGSMIRHLADIGLLTPRTTIAHGVWLMQDEIALMADHGAGIAHNPISNLKLKSGVAPMHAAMQAGVNVALGCDNCSCGDCQSMFQAMKMFCLLAAVTDPKPDRRARKQMRSGPQPWVGRTPWISTARSARSERE